MRLIVVVFLLAQVKYNIFFITVASLRTVLLKKKPNGLYTVHCFVRTSLCIVIIRKELVVHVIGEHTLYSNKNVIFIYI